LPEYDHNNGRSKHQHNIDHIDHHFLNYYHDNAGTLPTDLPELLWHV
jgi:hypothetical protein